MVRKELKNEDETGVVAIGSPDEPSESQRYIRWCDLLERVFGVDVLRCPRCGGRRHMISVITDLEKVRKVLEGVRRASRKGGVSTSGGNLPSAVVGRSPPVEVEAPIPQPPLQGRLDFGE